MAEETKKIQQTEKIIEDGKKALNRVISQLKEFKVETYSDGIKVLKVDTLLNLIKRFPDKQVRSFAISADKSRSLTRLLSLIEKIEDKNSRNITSNYKRGNYEEVLKQVEKNRYLEDLDLIIEALEATLQSSNKRVDNSRMLIKAIIKTIPKEERDLLVKESGKEEILDGKRAEVKGFQTEKSSKEKLIVKLDKNLEKAHNLLEKEEETLKRQKSKLDELKKDSTVEQSEIDTIELKIKKTQERREVAQNKIISISNDLESTRKEEDVALKSLEKAEKELESLEKK